MSGPTDNNAQRLGDVTFRVAFLFFTALALVPLWWVRIPPMQDIWQHLALVDVIHNYDAPGSIYPDYFSLPNAPRPNLVYYYLTDLLAYLAPLEIANKLVLSLYVVTFPAGFLYLLRSFGRSRWLSLFSFPLVYNAMFGYGFVSFLLAMPMLFFAVGAYRRFLLPRGDELDLRLGALAAALTLLTFFTHAHVYLLLCFLMGILLLIHREDTLWGNLLRVSPLLPALAFFGPWFWVHFVEHTPSSSGIAFGSLEKLFGPSFYKPSQILGNFFHYVGDYFRDESDDALFVGMMLIAMMLLIVRRAPTVPATAKRKLAVFDLEILTVALAVSCIVLPQHIEAQDIVSMRHVVFALLFFFGWLGVDGAPKRLVIPAFVLLGLLNVAWDVNLVRGFRLFDKELDGYADLFQDVNGGQRMTKALYNQESRYINYGALWHIHFFFTIEKGGISDMQFAEYPHNPIQYKRDMIPPQTQAEFYRSPVWRYYEYILVRKSSAPPMKPATDQLEMVSDVGDWALYHVTSGPAPRGPDDAPVARPRRKEVESSADPAGAPPVVDGGPHERPMLNRLDHLLPRFNFMRRGIEQPVRITPGPGPRPGPGHVGRNATQ